MCVLVVIRSQNMPEVLHISHTCLVCFCYFQWKLVIRDVFSPSLSFCKSCTAVADILWFALPTMFILMWKLLAKLGTEQQPRGEQHVWQQWTRGSLGSSRQECLETGSGSLPSANAGWKAVQEDCDEESWRCEHWMRKKNVQELLW